MMCVAVLAICVFPYATQLPSEFRDRTPAQLAAGAFEEKYGRLVVAEAARILRESADAGCLQSKRIDPAGFEKYARDLFVRNAADMFEIFGRLVDEKKFSIALAARAGEDAKAELLKLREDPEIKKLLALYDRARFVTVVDGVSENVARHAVLERYKLRKSLSPVDAGNAALRRVRDEEASSVPIEDFISSSKSPRVKRWLALQTALAEAHEESFDRDELVRYSPRQVVPNAATELANLCVPR